MFESFIMVQGLISKYSTLTCIFLANIPKSERVRCVWGRIEGEAWNKKLLSTKEIICKQQSKGRYTFQVYLHSHKYTPIRKAGIPNLA